MPASILRYKQPIRLPSLVKVRRDSRGLGFGTYETTKLNEAKPGLPVGKSPFYKQPVIDQGVKHQSVAPAPGTKYTQQYMKALPISLASTFTDTPYYISGTILWYMTSTNSTDQLQVRIASVNADKLPWGPGNGIEGVSFSVVYISNPVAVAGATATLVYFSDTPEAPARFF